MKHSIKTILAIALVATSCSPVYYRQITTLSSDDAKFNEKGAYVYENEIVSIEYNFWKEYGGVDFVVTNNTDDNIYLDFSQSFLVKNGYAYDYFQNRSIQVTEGLSISLASNAASAGSSTHAQASGYGYASGYLTGDLYSESSTSTAAVNSQTVLKGRNSSTMTTSQNAYSIAYQEMPVVCIPAHSSKCFGEFNVSDQLYRECSFVRDPQHKESVREFSMATSPLVIENRLMFIFGDVHIPVKNVFYASKYQNIAVDDEEKTETVKYCNGLTEVVRIHKLFDVNKFYITYTKADVYSSKTGPVMDNNRQDRPEVFYNFTPSRPRTY